MSSFVELAFNLPVKKLFTYGVPEGSAAPVGVRVSAPFGSRSLTGLVVAERAEPPAGVEVKQLKRVVDARPLFDERVIALAGWMARMYMCSLGEALSAMIPTGRREGETDELPLEEEPPGYALAEQQLSAIRTIAEQGTGSCYLFGVTGSGKTDVFLQAAQEAVSRGRGVIYLVPEISLTHQVVQRCGALFKDRLAILHSSLTPSQRLKEWCRCWTGRWMSLSVPGAPSLRHSPAWVSSSSTKSTRAPTSQAQPRVTTRGRWPCTARPRRRRMLLMGSATPSLEAWHRMGQGKLTALRLPARLSGGTMPAIEVVDMRRQQGPLSGRLLDELGRCHAEGRQSILFLNRRGFSYLFHCRSCGYEMACSHCSVSLTYHKERERMVCHYCGFSTAPITVCPQCGSLDVGYSGYGTEGIEEELQRQFPRMVIRRIDTDAVKKKKVLRQALADFREGRTHVLIGTQMVAKGLNFPGVKLVGIVNADTGFQLPDFRAAERTFSLLVQVSGRAGRSLPDGKVLIQTFRPGAPAIVMAQEGRLEEFYALELEARRQLAFPPFCRLLRLVVRGRNRQKTLDAITALTRALQERCGEAGEMLGPAECPLARISGNYRYQTIVRTTRFSEAHARVSAALEEFKTPSGVYIEVDVDPQALL